MESKYYLSDLDVNASDIPSNLSFEKSEDAIASANDILPTKYISLINKNDLSKVMVYRRTHYKKENLSIYKWDGISCDTSWYNGNEDSNIFYIQNAAQLAGLRLLVESGINFKGKTVQLTSDINLNHKYWKPIGMNYEITDVDDDNEYFRIDIPNPNGVFSGIFDGNNFAIYGLSVNTVDDQEGQYFAGLFGSLNEADIRNVILSDVMIGSDQFNGKFASLFGYARKSKFINISIEGYITGSNCSGLGCVAVDCSFTECINRAKIDAHGMNINDEIIVGGLVQYIGLSSDVIAQVHTKEPAMFIKCLQAGEMKINAKGAGIVYCGQLFGATLYKKTGESYGIQIDHCGIYDGGIPEVINLDDSLTRTNFFGKVNGSSVPKNCISGIDTKLDLLGGLLGKTNIRIAVSVIRVTSSTKIDALVIPGSVNTLKSQEHMNSFITKDVGTMSDNDVVSNLYPYYDFVKQSKI